MIRATANGHAFEYADGTPYFLLGDTWWATPTFRFRWRDDDTLRPLGPEAGLKEFVAYRRRQEFNCIAILAALPNWANDDKPATLKTPDGTVLRAGWGQAGTKSTKNMTDESGNRAFMFPGKVPGFEQYFPDVERINPAYFQSMDKKIDYLNSQGFVPFIEVARRDIGQAWKKVSILGRNRTRGTSNTSGAAIRRTSACIVRSISIRSNETIPADDWNAAANAVIDEYGPPPFGTLAGTNPTGSSLRNWGHMDKARWLGFHQIGNLRTHDSYALLTEIFSRPIRRCPASTANPITTAWKISQAARMRRPLLPLGDVWQRSFRRTWRPYLRRRRMAGRHLERRSRGGFEMPNVEGIRLALGRPDASPENVHAFGGTPVSGSSPCTDQISPNKSGKPKGSARLGIRCGNRTRDLFMLYFEKDCPMAALSKAKSNSKYRAGWFNPQNGRWIAVSEPILADDSGKIVLPQFPDTAEKSETDWCAKAYLDR